jgi:TPR repeat protein
MARIAMSEVQKAEIAAQLGAADALFDLGLMYSTGREVDQDLVTAHKWFNLAALKGNHAARDYRAEIAQEMTSSDIAEAQRMAREWLTAN